MKFPDAMKDGDYRKVEGFTGRDVRAAEVKSVAFPQLLAPVDDLPPATLITGIEIEGTKRHLRGVSHDNGEVATVLVNGQSAKIVAQHAGVADWEITLEAPADGRFVAKATDRAGNAELTPYDISTRLQ